MPAGILFDARGTGAEVGGELRERTQRFPFLGAFGLGKRLGVGAVLGNPTPQLVHGDRAVLLTVFSYNSIHKILSYGYT